MKHHKTLFVLFLLLTVSVQFVHRFGTANGAKLVLFSAQDFRSDLMKTQDAQVATANDGGQKVLQVATGHKADWPGITLSAPDQHWDLSTFHGITVPVRNIGTGEVTVNCRVDSPNSATGQERRITGHVDLKPGESKQLTVTLQPLLPTGLEAKLYGMRGYPGGYAKGKGIDPSQITQLIIFINKPEQDHTFQIGAVRSTGEALSAKWLKKSSDEFFPMIDRLGQFAHADWPGKTHRAADMKEDIEAEQKTLDEYPGPADWDQYGGWREGPQLNATGYFYPTKHDGKWWLVDPAGRLFWSHGVDCVGYSQGATPTTDREFYFAKLPEEDSPLARFYGRGSWAPHGYYEAKGTYRTYNFVAANLMRKYGDDWQTKVTNRIHQRLRSWSMNSIGNWSDAAVYSEQKPGKRKTPYVVSAGSSGAKPIEGSSGYWGKFPDPFDPSFREALDKRMRWQRNKTAGDPWCIGYFVDNELAWGDEYSLATATLASPPEQASKKAFLADLKTKYNTIGQLNEIWKTNHESWRALAESRTPPDTTNAADDLGAFYTRLAEQYFRNCREAVKQVAPHNLYLGCRFAWVNDRGAKAAAKYCDVIGYNLYRDSVADFQLPEGVDMPVIIGEFHFGALDRGMFHTGLRPTKSQQARAQAYRDYVTGALKNPCLVGSHWFQYADQATTGRGDGENYQIGLVNVCDRPYPETIAAVREVGNSMYRVRSEGE